ncbi:hypothetical protein DENIS_2655 [Desulfonema ishimotonii]|uniref:TolC family protein n=1 Tax=Desulfonema ishimotonii TaxID=45657 RepID=A0A401FXN5_9BACT|nr:hypothetical protein DENIS_2655 [Desulfonema ishimotonii]
MVDVRKCSFRKYAGRRLSVWTGLMVCVAVICGCADVYEVDLTAQRQKNLESDLAFFKPRENMRFSAPLTLSDAIRVGLENNLDIRVRHMMTQIADDTTVAEKLKMLPRLNASGNLFWRDKYLQREYVDKTTGAVSLSNSVSEDTTRKTLSIGLSWNILDFGLSYIRSRQAVMNAEVKVMEEQRQAQTLAMEITAAYWASVLAERDLDYIREIEASVREYKDKAHMMVAQRRLDPIAVKEMESQLLRLTISASELQADIADRRIELCRLMGLTPMARFDLAEKDVFDAYLKQLPDARLLDPKKLELISLNNRPEMYSADLQENIQQDEARAALVSMFPGITFDASWKYDADSHLLNNDWVDVGAGLVSNLLALPYRYAEWKAKEKSVSVSRLQRLMLTAGVIAQVHMALQDYRNKAQHFNLQENAWGVTEELLEMSRERNAAGMKGFSDTVVTQRMLESMLSRLERDRSLVALLNSYNTLLVTLGFEYSRWHEDLVHPSGNMPSAPELNSDIRSENRGG